MARGNGLFGAVALFAAFAAPGLALAAKEPGSTHLFSSEANARDICGNDRVVWAAIKDPEYFRKGSPRYAQGDGAYTCEHFARARHWTLGK